MATASVWAAIFLTEFHVSPTATARPIAGSTTRPKNIVGDIGSSLTMSKPAVADRHDTIGNGADERVVAHDQESPALGPRHVAEQSQYDLTTLGVEIAGRFVGENHRRRTRERTRHGDALALTSREVAGPEVLALAQADGLEDAVGLAPGSWPSPSLQVQAVLHVLRGGQRGKEIELLKHKADGTAPTSRSRSGRSASITCPSMTMRPLVGVNKQPRMHKSVVFPEPDGPSSATTSPRSTDSETPRARHLVPSLAVGLRHFPPLEHHHGTSSFLSMGQPRKTIAGSSDATL